MEVARNWRLKQQRYNPSGETCGNCGENEMVIGRPVCGNCGLVFKHEGLKISGVNRIASLHKVIGKEMGVYFTHELSKSDEMRILVDMPKTRVEEYV